MIDVHHTRTIAALSLRASPRAIPGSAAPQSSPKKGAQNLNLATMTTRLFTQFSSAIGDCCVPDDPSLQLAASGPLAVYYAPFDAVYPQARVVLVGITPGRTQATNALAEARKQIANGMSHEEALQMAKRIGAFSGAMRINLTAMLDHIGLHRWLGLSSCDELFGTSSSLLQSTSVLPFPVFLNGANYNGIPGPITTPLLRQQVLDHFLPMAHALSRAVFIPLGPVPTQVLQWLVSHGHLSARRLLIGLPHPSGANAERIQYFLGKKEVSKLSVKTDPVKLDAARLHLRRAVESLS